MTTTTYFEKKVRDGASDKTVYLDVGKTNYGGEGPQMYLNLGESSILLSHEDAKAFCDAVASVAGYFGYDKS